MEIVNIYQAKTKLSELVARAAAGEEIILARNGHPAAKLVPLGEPKAPEKKMTLEESAIARGYGVDKGLIWIADDFDAPIPELEEYFQ